METIKSSDVTLAYGCDTSKDVFEDVPNSEVRFFLLKRSISEDENGKLYTGNVYAADAKKRLKYYVFGKWRYSFKENFFIDSDKIVELLID